jgi:diguanylate cyclase (GGDEF)-like protein
MAAIRSVLAATDRRAAAADRAASAHDRDEARIENERLVAALELAAIDELTGARTRRDGLTQLDLEISRSRRTGTTLIVTYVDVIGLRSLNKLAGHAAGDELLTTIVTLIRACLRPYDLIIRLGGDEFLCAVSDMDLPHVRARFTEVADQLDASSPKKTIRVGFAEMETADGTVELIDRADQAMLRPAA